MFYNILCYSSIILKCYSWLLSVRRTIMSSRWILILYIWIRDLHCIIQINHQPDATIFQFIILTFIYSSTCIGPFPAHHQELNDCSGTLWVYLRIVVKVVLCSCSGRPAGTTTKSALKNCCISLMTYLNCTMMHWLTNLKFYI